MAGGIGSRFWPMSRTNFPKQFLDILGTGKTLIQQTFDRYSKLVQKENIYVVTAQEYVNIVKKQLPDIPEENILAEPSRKNTAPCIAYIAVSYTHLRAHETVLDLVCRLLLEKKKYKKKKQQISAALAENHLIEIVRPAHTNTTI